MTLMLEFTVLVVFALELLKFDIVNLFFPINQITDFYKKQNLPIEFIEYPEICRNYSDEKCATKWLSEIHKVEIVNLNKVFNVNFQNSINNTKENTQLAADVKQRYAILMKSNLIKSKKFQWKNFKDPTTKRLFELLTRSVDHSNTSITKRIIELNLNISYIYNRATPCFNRCLQPGESEIRDMFETEKDYDILSGLWSSWRNATGPKIKPLFVERMKLKNDGAVENGYQNVAKFNLLREFEDENFDQVSRSLYDEILPLYRELHGYVRYCLSKYYPGRFDKHGPIPAHILGNVWGQEWGNLFPIIEKCRNKSKSQSVFKEVNKSLKGLQSVKDMFLMAEDFFVSIGLFNMTNEFWERSVFMKPEDVIMNCHGSAHDFLNNRDFRIKMCAEKKLSDFTTAHHEMGHIQYYMAYKEQHFLFKGSANSGFHEAIGDLIALSVKTPQHLHKVGLISKIEHSNDFDLDYLLVTALNKIAFLPFALTMDSFLWGVYNGSVSIDNFNKFWWELRYKYQGLKSPIARSENDFDPGAKFHISMDITYIRYFVSDIIQFQFYEALCEYSNHKGPLHRCDFYQSKKAGSKLLDILKLGKSKPWQEVLKMLTGTDKINPKSILKYFEPLHQWLQKVNKKNSIPIGW